MEQARSSKWHPFWKNLRQGYDFFEENKFPPDVQVTGKRYIFD
jgi:murein L,D-transpeptidase YafK